MRNVHIWIELRVAWLSVWCFCSSFSFKVIIFFPFRKFPDRGQLVRRRCQMYRGVSSAVSAILRPIVAPYPTPNRRSLRLVRFLVLCSSLNFSFQVIGSLQQLLPVRGVQTRFSRFFVLRPSHPISIFLLR